MPLFLSHLKALVPKGKMSLSEYSASLKSLTVGHRNMKMLKITHQITSGEAGLYSSFFSFLKVLEYGFNYVGGQNIKKRKT